MKGLSTIIAWELREKRSGFMAAFLASLLPLSAPIVASVAGLDVEETRDISALSIALAYAAAVALMHGSTTLSRELKERRIGFWFSRPLTEATIWWGKVLSGWILAVACWLVILLPALLIGLAGKQNLLRILFSGESSWILAQVILLGNLLLICLAHALGIVLRSRSRLIVVDVLALLGVGFLIGNVVDLLLREGAYDVVQGTMYLLSLGLLVALIVAGQCSLAQGRSDIVRTHLALSRTLWPIFGAMCLVSLVFALWFRNVSPADLVAVSDLSYTSNGKWVVVSGPVRHRGFFYPRFLLNIQTRQSMRLRSAQYTWSDVALSDDGARAVWIGGSGLFQASAGQLMTLDLHSQPLRVMSLPLVFANGSSVSLRLSSDGKKVALFDGSTVAVHEVLTGKSLIAKAIGHGERCVSHFVRSNETLRLICRKDSAKGRGLTDYSMYDIELGTRKTNRTDLFSGVPTIYPYALQPNSDWTRFLCRERSGNTTRILTLDSTGGGRPLTLPFCTAGSGSHGVFLADGRTVVSGLDPDTSVLCVYSRSGEVVRSIPLGQKGWTLFGGELQAGRLVVSVQSTDRAGTPFHENPMLVNLENGEIERFAAGYYPILGIWGRFLLPTQPGSVATRLFIGPDGELAVLDPQTHRFSRLFSEKSN